MNRYRLLMTIDDDIEAKDLDEAWEKFRNRIKEGYYGPTIGNVEFIGEVIEYPTATE
jgi:hypothetical protein